MHLPPSPNNIYIFKGWWSRFFPAAAKIRDILTDGIIGEVKFMQCGFGFPMSFKERLHKKGERGAIIIITDDGCFVCLFFERMEFEFRFWK